MYAARKQGFTAVPVIQGMAAVVTTATCREAPCKLLTPRCNRGGICAYRQARLRPNILDQHEYANIAKALPARTSSVYKVNDKHLATVARVSDHQPTDSQGCQCKRLVGVGSHFNAALNLLWQKRILRRVCQYTVLELQAGGRRSVTTTSMRRAPLRSLHKTQARLV